ncbi:hypothetical protein Adt_05931 [Abeliophyllum distichum]|uniref:Uncharacterized protein n=1 Tax=Abeliophyllum distichum TaxID=126358 RepID=A0ABD1V7K8_9LAMI
MSTIEDASDDFEQPLGMVVDSLLEFSPLVAEVRPLQGVDALTGKKLAIFPITIGGPQVTYQMVAPPVRDHLLVGWTAMDVSSIVNEVDLETTRRLFRVPSDIVFPKEGLYRLHFQSFNIGMRLLLDSFCRRILRVYGLA